MNELIFRQKDLEVFQQYEKEIEIDVNDFILKSQTLLIRDLLIQLGKNEIHYIIKYHQKVIQNTIFFSDIKIIEDYQEWLYRVYSHKNIDTNFFVYLNELFIEASSSYLQRSSFENISKIYSYLNDKHDYFVKESKKDKMIIKNNEEVEKLTTLLIENKENEVKSLLKSKISSMEDFLECYDNLITPSMKKIGLMWEVSKISVAKEHIASNIIESVIFLLLADFKNNSKNHINILLSTAPNEMHGLGVKIASKVLKILGCEVYNFGSNTSKMDIVKVIEDINPQFVILSAAMTSSLIDLRKIIDEFNDYRNIYKNKISIGIAGNAFENIIMPTKKMKVNFYCKNLSSLVQIIKEIK